MRSRTSVKKLISRIPSRLQSLQTSVRCMTTADIDSACTIEESSFDFPWNSLEFANVIRKPEAGGLVAVQNGQVVGYLCYQYGPDYVTILTLGVDFLYRREGVGRILVRALAQRLGEYVPSIMLTVRERNLDAQLFFRALGFNAVAIMRDFYDKISDDAYIMEYKIDQDQTISLDEIRAIKNRPQRPVKITVNLRD